MRNIEVLSPTSCEIKGDITPPKRPIIEQDVSATVRNVIGYTSDVIKYRKFQFAVTPHLPRIANEMTSHSLSTRNI